MNGCGENNDICTVWGQHTYIDVSDHDRDVELCEEEEGEKGVVVRGKKITKRKISSSQERGVW